MDKQTKAGAQDWIQRQGSVSTYIIMEAQPAPSMSLTQHEFTGAYWQAVAHAQDLHRAHGRTVLVTSSGVCSEWWHRCCNMVATDRNTNSGVPAQSAVVPADLQGPLLAAEGGAL